MKRIVIMAVLIAGGGFMAAVPAAAEAIPDYDFTSYRALNTPIADLAMTPDDQYLVVLREQSIRFIDTSDFTVLEGETAEVSISTGNTVALCLSLSPDGGYAYVGLSSGEISVVDLSPLYSGMSQSPSKSYYTISVGNSVESIAAIPEDNASNNDVFILMGVPGENKLYWAETDDPGNTTFWGSSPYQPLFLATGVKHGFELYKDSGGYHIEYISCISGPPKLCQPPSKIDLSGQFKELVVDRLNENFAVTAEITTKNFWLIDTHSPDLMNILDIYPIEHEPQSLALLENSFGTGYLVFSTSGEAVLIHKISSDGSQFTGDSKEVVEAGQSFSVIAASSDGKVYAASGTRVYQILASEEAKEEEEEPSVPPTDLKFELDFLDRAMIVAFDALNRSDIDSYAIYYGLNGSAPPQAYQELDDIGGDGVPGSPIVIYGLQANEDYEKKIKGLVNGLRYYVQMMAVVNTGEVIITPRKSVVVQPTSTLTGETGEEGGVECLGSVALERRGDPRSAAWLLVPVAVAGAYHAIRRRRR